MQDSTECEHVAVRVLVDRFERRTAGEFRVMCAEVSDCGTARWFVLCPERSLVASVATEEEAYDALRNFSHDRDAVLA
jgi:hypothetical protein